MKKVITQLRRTIKDDKLFTNIILNRLNEIKIDRIQYYKLYLKAILGFQYFFRDKIELLIDKIKALLVHDHKENNIFAIDLMLKLKIIPESKKEVIKALLKEIRKKKLSNKENQKIKELENKLSR